MQAQHKLMQMMVSSQGNNATSPPTKVPCANMEGSKWDSKVAFGADCSWVDMFTTNAFTSLEGKLSKYSTYYTYYLYLYYFFMLQFPSNNMVLLFNNASYVEKLIDMWNQVCKSHGTHAPKELLANIFLLFVL